MKKANLKKRLPLSRVFTRTPPLGGSVAEREQDLPSYYLDVAGHVAAVRHSLPGLFVFIGPKGAGKSAIQRMILEQESTFNAEMLTIRPDDLSLWSIVKAPQLAGSLHKEIDARWLNKTLWNYLFVVEILKKEYGDSDTIWRKISAPVLDALRLNTPRAAEKLKELLDCGHAPTELRCAIYILESCPDHDRLPKDYPEALKMLRERLETGKLRLVEVDTTEEPAPR
jgi:hypothetical protein